MRKISFLLPVVILVACTQEPVKISYNDKKLYTKNNYVNYNYNKGSYRTLPDGRIVRDITLRENNGIGSDKDKSNKQNKESSNSVITKEDNSKITSDSYYYIIVKPEDSLYRISKSNNISLSDLARINDINEPYNIKVGQKIRVPRTNLNSQQNSDLDIRQQDGNGLHIVKQGETLYSISRAYNMDMDEIIRTNKLEKPYNLYLGQKLLLKKTVENNSEKILKQEKTKNVEELSNKNESGNFVWPINGEIVKKFGEKTNDVYHDGINIKSQKGTEIRASKSGEVAYSGDELKGYGNIIILRHEDNWLTIYAHCEELKVKQGYKVKQGDVIATVGNTGHVNDYQLYFSIREGREAKDPLKFLK